MPQLDIVRNYFLNVSSPGHKGNFVPCFRFGILLSALDTQAPVVHFTGPSNNLNPVSIFPSGWSTQL